jgi:hypothetical protein
LGLGSSGVDLGWSKGFILPPSLGLTRLSRVLGAVLALFLEWALPPRFLFLKGAFGGGEWSGSIPILWMFGFQQKMSGVAPGVYILKFTINNWNALAPPKGPDAECS